MRWQILDRSLQSFATVSGDGFARTWNRPMNEQTNAGLLVGPRCDNETRSAAGDSPCNEPLT